MIIPQSFNLERYKHYFMIEKDSICGVPVYFRKSYEMNLVVDKGQYKGLYFPAEMSEAKHYVFDKIV